VRVFSFKSGEIFMKKLYAVIFFLIATVIFHQTALATSNDESGFRECVDRINSETTEPEDYDFALDHRKRDNQTDVYKNQYGLTYNDLLAIYAYSRNVYMPVNSALWTHHEKPYNCFISQLNKALRKLPDFQGVVYRGAELPVASLAQHIPGNVVTYLGFTSTSENDIPWLFGGTPVHLKIHAYHGKKIAPLTAAGDIEREVLFAPRTCFQVLNRKEASNKNAPIEIEMEEVTCKK
jgi:hypothetical protein